MAYNTPRQPHSQPHTLSRRELYVRVFILVFAFISILPSCKPNNVQTGTTLKYFDLKGYFKADTAKLRKLNRLTLKTVTHNGITETKKVHINNWGLELSLFIQSDINKPAWRDNYTIQNSVDSIIYRAKTYDLKTQLIVINKKNNKVKSILIHNNIKNMLYQTTEDLNYFPDSLYIIKKYQKVRLLGANQYVVKGSLN